MSDTPASDARQEYLAYLNSLVDVARVLLNGEYGCSVNRPRELLAQFERVTTLRHAAVAENVGRQGGHHRLEAFRLLSQDVPIRWRTYGTMAERNGVPLEPRRAAS
ncbi:hypothetical protein ACQEVF_56670 [Nonomuraea polychroma]|uniref:hypothetical protein n=1 Tax=Nonomuraea polychroma TaxID=46176 RepID=UPI003D94559E